MRVPAAGKRTCPELIIATECLQRLGRRQLRLKRIDLGSKEVATDSNVEPAQQLLAALLLSCNSVISSNRGVCT